MNSIDVGNITLHGQALSLYEAARMAYASGATTTLIIRAQPVAVITPVNRSVYTALRDDPGLVSEHVGVFSSEELARTACQENQDAHDEAVGRLRSVLAWTDSDDRSGTLPDGSSYTVILTSLDIPTGQG